MTDSEDMKKAIVELLDQQGTLNSLKAHIRAEVFTALCEKNHKEKQSPSKENLIINDLIREYLEFNKLRYSESVFLAETGHPKQALGNDFARQQLGLEQDKKSESIPLLYSMIEYFVKEAKNITAKHGK